MLRFLGGKNIKQACALSRKNKWTPIYDNIKESTKHSIAKNLIDDMEYIKPDDFLSIKYSSFAGNTKDMLQVIEHANKKNINLILDAESIDYTTNEELFLYNLPTNTCVWKTYQMYRKDSLFRLERDILNRIELIKLTRGAYYNRDYKSGLLYENKKDTDNAYNEAIHMSLKYLKENESAKLMIATHNEESVKIALQLINYNKDDSFLRYRIYFAQLLGMSDNLTEYLGKSGYLTLKYVPYGPLTYSIPYLSRRLCENYTIIEYIFKKYNIDFH